MSGRGSVPHKRGSRGGRRRGYGPTGFEDQGGYMAAKVAKLTNQFNFAAELDFGEERCGIFRGVAIFVNGYTEPTADELKRIMLANGGTFHHYYSRSKTTHIIATNLPDSKVKNMNTDRIVSPKWISDSLKAGNLLDYTKYVLYTNQSTKQPKIQFNRISSADENEHPVESESTDLPMTDCSGSFLGSSQDASEGTEVSKGSKAPSRVYHSEDEDLFSDSPEINRKESKLDSKTEMEVSDPPSQNESGLDFNDEVEVGDFLITRETELSLKGKGDARDPSLRKESEVNSKTKLKLSGPSAHLAQTTLQHTSPSKSHSMSTANPKFLSEYYNNSRLHHISTMGATFKQYVTEMQSKQEGFPSRKSLKDWVKVKRTENSENSVENASDVHSKGNSKSKRTIMHIDMDCFFVSVGLRNHPELRGIPVAVTHAKGGGKSQAREGVDRHYELNFYKERAEKRLQGKMKSSNISMAQDSSAASDFHDEDENKEHTGKQTAPKFSTLPLIDETCSMSEIASCSYEARNAGVRNGMFMGPALKLCPNLKTLPYDFEGYKEVAYKLYNIVASFTHDIEAVSCDEMFIDLTEVLNDCKVTPLEFASYLRQEVHAATGCHCSAGMGPNMLVARMATRRAKPNGQYMADPERLAEYMINEKVTDLPGVGWSLGKRLEIQNIKTCGDLQVKSLGQLQALFGSKNGQSLYYYCRGIDDRLVKSEHVRKSVSAEVNYGIRFTSQADVARFIGELSNEVENRLTTINLKGKCITLKLKVRAKDAPVETAKYMGHGVCDNIAKSVSLGVATSSSATIEREMTTLLRQIKVPPQDFRGVGIQVSRLEGHQSSSSAGSASIKSFMLSAKSKSEKASADAKVKMSTSEKNKERDTSFPGNTSHRKIENHLSPSFSPSSTPQPSTSTGQPPTSKCRNSPIVRSENSTSAAKGAIDVEVLMALPEDMREQVIAEYLQQGYTVPESYCSSVDKGKGTSNDPQPSTSYSLGVSNHRENVRSRPVEDNSVQRSSERNIVPLEQDKSNQHATTSLESDDSDHEALVTSFSQVDSSFLAAIPVEMREELRKEFERKKHLASGGSSSHQPKQQISGIKNNIFQNSMKTNQRGQTATNDLRRAVLDGPSRSLPPQPIRVGKKRGRKPKSLGHSNRKSPVKSNSKKGTFTSPKKTKPGVFADSLSLSENKTWSQDSTADSIYTPSSSNQKIKEEDLASKEMKKEETPQLCGAIELPEVKALIRQWVSSCPNPEEEDVDIIATYCTNLITFRDLEKVDLLIKHLYRQVIRTHNPLWQSAYNGVIDRVQSVMLSRYEAKLKVASIVLEES